MTFENWVLKTCFIYKVFFDKKHSKPPPPPGKYLCKDPLRPPRHSFFLTPTSLPTFLKFGTEGCPPAERGERGVDTVSSFGKVVGWLDFEDKPKVQKKRQVKNQQSHIPIYVGYPTCSSSNQEYRPRNDNAPCKKVWLIYRV